MKSLLIILFSLLSVALYAQQSIARYSYHDQDNNKLKEIYHVRDTFNNVLEGPYLSYYLNGNIESKGQFSNNETVGVWEFYYETGKLKMRGALRNNSNYGNWEYFYENGNKQMEGKIINRKREGPWKMYYESGELKSEGDFSGNRRAGLWKFYYESGELKGEVEYTSGKGKSTEYYHTGEKKAEGSKSGLHNTGHWIFYYKNGAKQAEGNYTKGNRTGEWAFYHPDGYLSSKGNYEDNEPSGEWNYYDDSGELSAEGFFREGEKEGVWNSYYPGGGKKSSTEYSGDIGVYKEFYEDGELKVTGILSDGVKNGPWKYYYNDGNLEGEVEFKNGRGMYTGYYSDGTIYVKGLIENDQRIGTWEIYDNSGTLKGYYKPFYKSNSLNFNDLEKVSATPKRNYGVADYGFKSQKYHYFKPKLNEFKGIILSTNPLTPFIGRLPVGVELYYQERLGYEILVEGIRNPFYIENEKVSQNVVYTRGFTGALRQKFYNSDNRFGLFYFGHSLSYSNFNHMVNLSEQPSDITTEKAKEIKYIYSLIAGYRLMEYTYKRGFTLDGYIGLGSGYRKFDTAEGNEEHFKSLPDNKIPLDFKFGVTFGYSYPLKRKR